MAPSLLYLLTSSRPTLAQTRLSKATLAWARVGLAEKGKGGLVDACPHLGVARLEVRCWLVIVRGGDRVAGGPRGKVGKEKKGK